MAHSRTEASRPRICQAQEPAALPVHFGLDPNAIKEGGLNFHGEEYGRRTALRQEIASEFEAWLMPVSTPKAPLSGPAAAGRGWKKAAGFI
jgi:hypothetical protein